VVGVVEALLGAAALFAVTNIDGLIVLTALFMASARGGPKVWQIIVGQYVGFAAMVALSLLAAAGLFVVPGEWEGLVGVLPLALGASGLVRSSWTRRIRRWRRGTFRR
jgi:cadmium resistance protein CadD (predicted permease)